MVLHFVDREGVVCSWHVASFFSFSFFLPFIIFFVVLFLLFVNYDDGTRHENFIGVLVEMFLDWGCVA